MPTALVTVILAIICCMLPTAALAARDAAPEELATIQRLADERHKHERSVFGAVVEVSDARVTTVAQGFDIVVAAAFVRVADPFGGPEHSSGPVLVALSRAGWQISGLSAHPECSRLRQLEVADAVTDDLAIRTGSCSAGLRARPSVARWQSINRARLAYNGSVAPFRRQYRACVQRHGTGASASTPVARCIRPHYVRTVLAASRLRSMTARAVAEISWSTCRANGLLPYRVVSARLHGLIQGFYRALSRGQLWRADYVAQQLDQLDTEGIVDNADALCR